MIVRRRRALLWIVPGAALLSVQNACQDVPVGADIAADSPFVSLDLLPAGESALVAITLAHTGGTTPITIEDIDIQGDWYQLDGPIDPVIPIDGELTFDVRYTPLAAGYHQAEVIVSHDGASGVLAVHIEGRAVKPSIRIYPTEVDFGVVPPRDYRSRTIKIANDSRWDLTLTDASCTGRIYALHTKFPQPLPSGEALFIPLEAVPIHDQPAAGSCAVYLGDLQLPAVEVLANDCEHGLPSAYDHDEDGVSFCRGDCDDSDPTIHPGSVEIFGNGVDEDCDWLAE